MKFRQKLTLWKIVPKICHFVILYSSFFFGLFAFRLVLFFLKSVTFKAWIILTEL